MNTGKLKYIIGIDEVGRGALAGPVAVAAVMLPLKLNIKNQIRPSGDLPLAKAKIQIKNKNLKVRDSKKLSPRQREIWFEFIKKQPKVFYAIASVSPKIIDKINISRAANLAAKNAFMCLIKNSKLKIKNCAVFLDGGLYLGNKKFLILKSYVLNPHTIIKGDEKIPAISLASIVAKVSRDKMMKKLHKKYPLYDFVNNVGYGTKRHIKAIKKYGRLPIHRKSFKIK